MPTVNTPHISGLLNNGAVLDRAAHTLAERYAGVYAVETIRQLLDDSHR